MIKMPFEDRKQICYNHKTNGDKALSVRNKKASELKKEGFSIHKFRTKIPDPQGGWYSDYCLVYWKD
jgi:hypothetical protein